MTKWIGPPPAGCDLCHEHFADVFIDGKTIYRSWANMCPTCHADFGVGLGTGRGQRYERQPDGSWLKTAG